MPFRPWIRWKSGRAHTPALAEDIERLCADPRVHRLFDWFSRHERDIADFQLAITAIPAPPFGEQARAAWLRERLQPLGLTLATDSAGNLLAARPGLHPASPSEAPLPGSDCADSAFNVPAIALSAHLDTVFPAGTSLDIRREHARLLGPGISDNGSGLAALWALAAGLHQLGIVTTLPLLFLANVGEEGEGNLRGMRHIYRLAPAAGAPAPAAGAPAPAAGAASVAAYPPAPAAGAASVAAYPPAPAAGAASVAAYPTPAQSADVGLPPATDAPPAIAMLIALDGAGAANVISQALGSRRFQIVITGPGGHSWSDFGAPNPIVAASLAVGELFNIPLPVNPRTTLNVGSIEGGTSINAIPSRAVVKVDVRSSDPRRLDELEKRIRHAVADACEETLTHSNHSAGRLEHSVTVVGERPAGELPAASPLLAAIQAVDAHLGIHSQLQRASTDANIPLSLGLEAISLGSGGSGGGAHTLHEWYDPAGREQGLKRIALLLLLLAGLPPAEAPSAEARQSP